MNPKITLLGVLIAFSAMRAHADSLAIFGNHSMLKNHVIVDVGDVSQVEPPFNTKWKEDVYQVNGWSVWGDQNWRMTFKIEDGHATVVDYRDYH